MAVGIVIASLVAARSTQAATQEFTADVGFAQRALYRVPIELGSLRMTFGARGTHLAGGFRTGMDAGRTLEGLTIFQGHAGFVLEYVVGRARFGFGGGVGILSIARATRGDALTALFLEGTLRIAVDVLRFGPPRPVADDNADTTRPALFLAAELELNSAQVWGPSLAFGVRY